MLRGAHGSFICTVVFADMILCLGLSSIFLHGAPRETMHCSLIATTHTVDDE